MQHGRVAPEDLRARQEQEGVPKPYWDEELRTNNDSYIQLIADLYERGMVTYEKDCDCQADIFFVTTKNGHLRLIADARRGDQLLHRPPRTRLAPICAAAEIHSGLFTASVCGRPVSSLAA